MKLLIDENLPDALIEIVSERFPGSAHVKQLALTTTDDEVIWRFARDNDFALLTQDSDFERKAAQRGAPPKVILGGPATSARSFYARSSPHTLTASNAS